jgi:hypothetical protein
MFSSFLVAIAAGRASEAPAAPAELPEDEPLPAASNTLNATTANFDSVYASAAAGSHIILANGNYGARTLNRTFSAGSPLVIRAQNRLGAVFTSISITGGGQIISGMDVDLGAAATAGNAVAIGASNIRVTRCRISNGAFCINVTNTTAIDILVDHCDISRSRNHMFQLSNPPDQKRIIIARCWCHDILAGGSFGFSHMFGWTTQNQHREKAHNIIVRLNYCDGEAAGANSDLVHHKGSSATYALNRFNSSGLLSHRFGLRARWIGNYGPSKSVNAWDDLGWYYGNSSSIIRGPAGRSCYYDDTKNLAGLPNNSVGGFHANKRSRFAGNSCTIDLGWTSGVNWCTATSPDPATLPDPVACGMIKPARSFNGINYAADNPADPDVGVKIRAHSGSITLNTESCVNLPGGWVQNLDSQPGASAPSSWLTELLTEHPWIADICPNPTSLTGGPGGSAPWSIAQGLTRGDAANPNTGPFRASPGGLP